MLRKLPGIDIPVATAFLEFKQHVERLARDGSHTAAYTCWMQLTVVQPIRRVQVPVVGPSWSSRGVVLPPDVAPSNAWQYYCDNQDRMVLAAYSWCLRNFVR